jgi:hypothetical protein
MHVAYFNTELKHISLWDGIAHAFVFTVTRFLCSAFRIAECCLCVKKISYTDQQRDGMKWISKSEGCLNDEIWFPALL